MRVMSLLVLIAFFIASLIPELLQAMLGMAREKHLIPYQYRQYLSYLDSSPWVPFVFGVTFGTVTHVTAEQNIRPTKEDVFAFVLIVTLIFIILQYGGVFAAPVLAAAHVDFYLFAKTMASLFIALVAWKGLHIPLGGLGVFLTTLLAISVAVMKMVGVTLPLDLDAYWFCMIGTFIGGFSAFSRS